MNFLKCFYIFLFFINSTTHEVNAINVDGMTMFLDHIYAPKRMTIFHCKKPPFLASFIKNFQKSTYQAAFMQVDKGISQEIIGLNSNVFIVDMNCSGFKHIFHKARDNNLFRKTHVWIFHGLIQQLGNHVFSKYGKTFIFRSDADVIDIYKIYKLTQSSNYSIERVYQYSTSLEIMKFMVDKNEKTLTNFHEDPIRVSYALLHNDSLDDLLIHINTGTSRLIKKDLQSKITYITIDEVCRLFNATHVPIIRNHWGSYNYQNDTFAPNKMYGDLENNVADLAGSTGTTTRNRIKHFKFLVATGRINKNRLKWFFRAPPLTYSENVWTLPFVKRLWMAIFVVVVIWGIACFLTVSYETTIFVKLYKPRRNNWFITIDLMISAFQGSHITWTGKLLYVTFSAMIIFLYAAYSAHLLLFLQSTSNIIHNYDDLSKSRMHLAIINEPYSHYYITTPNDIMDEDVRIKLVSRMHKRGSDFWMNKSQGFEMVARGDYAFHVEDSVGQDEIHRAYDAPMQSSIRTVDSPFKVNFHLCVPKNSTLDDVLSYGFLYLTEKGIIDRMQKSLFPENAGPDFKKRFFRSLDFWDMTFIFLILGVGMILSLIILVIEIIVFLFRKYVV